jgi:lysophospholipase L1-like esterase
MDGVLRVVVVGSSVGYYIRPKREVLAERTYGEHLERELERRGVPTLVTNSSRWTSLIRDANREIEELVLTHVPDVVVANYGILECEPATIPLALLRWLFTHGPSQSLPARVVRRALAPPLLRAYITLSPRVLRAMRLPARMGSKRFARELAQFVDLVHRERGGLVVLLGIGPPGDRLEEVLPGTRDNAARYTEIIRSVAGARAGTRFIEVDALETNGRDVVPDGIHFSARGHEALGRAIADEVIEWFQTEARAAGPARIVSAP